MSDFNQKIKQNHPNIECPFEHLLNTNYYEYSDCPNFGSSDCNLTMNNNYCCDYDKEFEKNLKETLSFKFE